MLSISFVYYQVDQLGCHCDHNRSWEDSGRKYIETDKGDRNRLPCRGVNPHSTKVS